MVRYDTHVHTSEGSACGKVAGADMVHLYRGLGYDGFFITDHFFNGNSRAPKTGDWAERVSLFCQGYENAKAEGDRVGFDVFFGFEFNMQATEWLVYGLDKAWLLAHPDADRLPLNEFAALAHESGAFIVHAHPFRQRPYIRMIRLLPDCVDAVEAVNAAHPDGSPFDDRAKWYAAQFGLPTTGGSDCHIVNQQFLGGIETAERFTGWQDYAQAVKSGAVTPIRIVNPGYDGLPGHGVTL